MTDYPCLHCRVSGRCQELLRNIEPLFIPQCAGLEDALRQRSINGQRRTLWLYSVHQLMVFDGQMARVPVTARQKFAEAAYFYNGMYAHRTNVVIFPYYLSAFLSALRSVTFYLQKQYAHDERFKGWYSQKQQEMGADPVLKNLNDRRVAVVHVEPFQLHFRKGYEMPAKYDGCITTNHLELRDEQDPDGQTRMYLKVGKDGAWEAVEPWISWHFDEDDAADVMNHCHAGLEKLDTILGELAELRLAEGLPEDEEIES